MTGTEHHHIDVTGMSCGNCVAHVEEALQGVDGVSRVTVDLERAHADVEGAGVDTNELVEAVVGAGYGVSSVD
jgi:copper chaperone CopZ